MMETYVVDKLKIQRLMLDNLGTTNQRLFCDRAGITEQTLIRMFKGKSFSSDTLYKICVTLKCGPEDILVISPKVLTLADAMAA